MNKNSINIIKAEPAGDYRLHLTFDDGKEQAVDFKPFLTRSQHHDIRSYLDPTRFATFRIEFGKWFGAIMTCAFPSSIYT